MSTRDFFLKMKSWLKLEGVPPMIRRVIVAVVGGTVFLIGVALIFLPGPAFIVIPIGLAILGSEFAWAKHHSDKVRNAFKTAKAKMSRGKNSVD